MGLATKSKALEKREEYKTGSLFQRQIMRRITIVMVIAFFLLTVFTALAIITSGRQGLRDSAETTLESAFELVRDEMDAIVGDVERVATSSTVRNYAWSIDEDPNNAYMPDEGFLDLQSEVLRSLDDLIRLHSGYYLSARYIAHDSREWGEVANRDGRIIISTNVQYTSYMSDPAFMAATTTAEAGEAFISPVHVSSDDMDYNFYIYVPVTTRSNISYKLGVIQMVTTADPILSRVQTFLNDPAFKQDGRRFILMDNTGRVIVDTDSSGDDSKLFSFLRQNNDNYVYRYLDRGTAVSEVIFGDYDGLDTPWRIVLVDDYGAAVQGYIGIVVIATLAYSVIFILILIVVHFTLTPITRPLTGIGVLAHQLTSGEKLSDEALDAQYLPPGSSLGILMKLLKDVSHVVEELSDTLEAQTHKRGRDMEVTARIGREVATLYSIDSLLIQTINLICDEFGFYHAQVFLVDDAGINAVLAHSRGKAGEKLLEQDFKIPVGSASIVGTVTGRKTYAVINDTKLRGDIPYKFNPALPDTRAELGLSLISGEQVIGALDIQSKETGAFKEEDIPTFMLLADQLAIAITNARLVNQSNKRIQQIDQLNRQLTGSAWQDVGGQTDVETSYRYNLLDVEKVKTGEEDIDPDAVSTAINIRGQVVGELMASAAEGQEFTDGDRVVLGAVANRISLAIENARLFQETQAGFAETSTLYQLSRYLNEANSLSEIIQAMIMSVMPESSGGQVWMFDEHVREGSPQWMTLVTDFALAERSEKNKDLTGLRLHVPSHDFLDENLKSNELTLISDTINDNRLDTGLKLIFGRFGAVAVVFIPLSVRSVWQGVIMITFDEPREFTEREGRIYLALIDQAGVTIDNRLLLRRTEEEVARNENLYAASRIINTAQNMKDLVYAAVATSTNPELAYSLSLLEGELDEGGWPIRARVVAESDNGMVREADFVYPIEIQPDSPLRNREPEIMTDYVPDNQHVPDKIKSIRERGYRFMATFPLFGANQPTALFQIMSSSIHEFSDNDFESYRAMTGQMSSQIQIRKLLERTEEALDEARRLYIASSSITSAPDSEAVFKVSVEHLARPLLQIQSGERSRQTVRISVLLAWPEPASDAEYLKYAYSWSSDSGEKGGASIGVRVSAEEYPYGRLTADISRPLYFNDIIHPRTVDEILQDESQFNSRLLENDIDSLAVAPIRSRQRWFGAIVCQSSHADAFDEQYLRFFMAVTDQVSIAVDNRRLFDEARSAAEQAQLEAKYTRALAEAAQLTSRMGGAADDISDSLNQTFSRIAEEGGFDRWLLLLFDDDGETLTTIIANAPDLGSDDIWKSNSVVRLPILEALRMGESLAVNDPARYHIMPDYDDAQSELLDTILGKHVAAPVSVRDQVFGGIFMGRAADGDDLGERDVQLVSTLSQQLALALENRTLFLQTQREQRYLNSILLTLPTGVIVFDSQTLLPIRSNDQAEGLLGGEIRKDVPFDTETYNFYRSGTDMAYPAAAFPIFIALESGRQEFCDDVVINVGQAQFDLLVNAAPIIDADNVITGIVVVLQDITSLRSLENTLQENLRETVTLYEAQRQLTEAAGLDDVLAVIFDQLLFQQPSDAYILTKDDDDRLVTSLHLLQPLSNPQTLSELLKPQGVTLISDIENDKTLDEGARLTLTEIGARSLIAVPLNVSVRDEPFGWMVAVSDSVDGFATGQSRTFEQISEIASTAIDNRLLIQRQQDTVQEVQALYYASNAISHSHDIEQLADVLGNAVSGLLPDYYAGYLDSRSGLAAGAMMLFNNATDKLSPLDFETLLGGQDIPMGGLYVDDLKAISDPGPLEQQLMANGIQSIAAVNLRPRDINSGFLVAAYRQPRKFTDRENRYLNTLSDGASVVFNNIILFGQIQATLEETSILYQASRALSDAATPEEILTVVVNHLAPPHINQVFIALLQTTTWDTTGASIKVISSWSAGDGMDFQGISLTQEQFSAWDVLAAKQVVSIDDVFADTNLSEDDKNSISSLGAQSVVIIPLRVATRAIGVIWIASGESYIYNERELRTYQSFAEQASLSMEAAFLHQQTERRARQLETSAAVSERVGQILDLEVLLPQMVDLIKDSFDYDHVQVFMMDSRDEYAELRASTGDAGRRLLSISHKLAKGSDSVIGQVTIKGKSTIALDTADADVVHRPNPHLPLTRSEMALPLIIKDEVVGALDVQSNKSDAFGEEDVQVLTTLAAQIAVAIDNANLYEGAQEQAANMGFLFEITSAAANAESLEYALQTVSELLHDISGALCVALYQPQLYVDSDENVFVTMKAASLTGIEQPISGIMEARVDDTTNLISKAYQDQSGIIVEDVGESGSYLSIAPSAQSAVIMPMISAGETIGMIVMEDERPNYYDADTMQLLRTLSGSLSAVVQSMQLLEQLTSTNEQLRELDRMKSAFLANMSHELRTPLNSIIGFSRVMLKGIDGTLTEMQEQDLTTIYGSGQHLLMLINDILDQAKIAEDKMEMKLDYFDIKPMIEGVRSIGIGLVKDTQVNILIEIAPNLPKAYGDEFRTRQVLLNLLSNAAKFTEEGSITVRVYTTEQEKTGTKMVRVDVVDTGIGIADKDLPLLFAAFRQIDSSLTRTQGGTGLGLPIAKSLVELQGGEMIVNSEVNVGSVFSITLPLEPVEDEIEEDDGKPKAIAPRAKEVPAEAIKKTTPQKPPASLTPPVMPTKREILLIEDNKEMVNQFRKALQREGFDVTTADHPSYAEAMVSNLRPTMIVMDVNFADGEGWAILEHLKDRDDTFDIPVVVVTLDDDSERAYQLGVHSFIQRPFMPEALVKAVLDAEKESNTDRILIIDDQPDSIRLLTQLLNEHGTYRVFSAESGVDGISLVARRHPDLIILDLRMPEMDGFAVLAELRSNPETANIPVLVITGDVNFTAEEQAQLENISVLYKTDVSQEEYDKFIEGVHKHLNIGGGE